MKKLNYFLFFVLIAGLTFITSCTEEEEEMFANPIVSLENAPADFEGMPGETVAFKVNVNAPGGFNVLRITKAVDGGTPSIFEEITKNDPSYTGDNSLSYDFSYTLQEAEIGSEIVFTFEGVDDQVTSTPGIQTFYINTIDVDINTYQTVLLGAQGSTEPSFYNALENKKYSYADAKTNASVLDLAYYYGATNENSLASIDDGGLNAVFTAVNLPINFTTKNATKFLPVTINNYDDIDKKLELQEAALFEAGGATSATKLKENDIIAFNLDDARGDLFGLIKIISVDDTNGNGTITIEVKIPVVE
ncbi:MAG: hypothetical protein ACNS62_16785 [Candidatus Cyclobacteriaceae bacterium M3_2C_046]